MLDGWGQGFRRQSEAAFGSTVDPGLGQTGGGLVEGRAAAYLLGMPPRTLLGQYLRARRELVRPEDVRRDKDADRAR